MSDVGQHTELELRMAAVVMFMPEIGDLPAVVIKDIIRRCANVATEHFDGGRDD